MKRAVKRCFVDVDGVVADLHTPLCEAFSFDHEKWPLGEFDLSKVFGVHPNAVWTGHLRSAAFWSKLPPLPWAGELERLFTNAFGASNVCFLTQPINAPGCYEGKALWLEANFPQHPFLMGTDKSICASDDALLIDDSEENVRSFEVRGGQTILVPRPWNSLHSIVDVLGYVNRQLVLGG